MERREFLRVGAMAAAGGAALTLVTPAGASASDGTTASTVAGIDLYKIGVKEMEYEDFYERYDIHDDIENFPGRPETAFYRAIGKEEGYEGSWDFPVTDVTPILGKVGYDYKDQALHNCRNKSFENDVAYVYHEAAPLTGEAYEFADADEAQDLLLRAAYFMGASEAGIAPYEPKLMYQAGLEEFASLGFEPKSVIIIAMAMNREVLMLSPLMVANGASFQAYQQVALQTMQISYVIKNLGYNAYPQLSHLCPSVGYGALAGLGEVARTGLLVNPRLGMNMRLAAVFTDIEATPTKPIEFGLQDFCASCLKCADNCPSESITRTETMSVKNPDSNCTNQSYTHWAVDGATCLAFWTENHADCARCVMSCPFTKEENWLHQSVRIMAGNVPGMHNIAREMDDLFGYGDDPLQDVDAAAADFWERRPEEIWKNRR